MWAIQVKAQGRIQWERSGHSLAQGEFPSGKRVLKAYGILAKAAYLEMYLPAEQPGASRHPNG